MIIEIYIIMKIGVNCSQGQLSDISIEDILFPQLENRPS